MSVEERAEEIARELGISYDLALMLAMSERGEFEGDLLVIDEDGNESEPALTPMEYQNGRSSAWRRKGD